MPHACRLVTAVRALARRVAAGSACAALLLAAMPATAPTALAHPVPLQPPRVSSPATELGVAVPWGAGGPRVEDGRLVQAPSEWPASPVRSVRLWDSRTAWLNLEPREGVFAFDQLDRLLDQAQARGVEHVTLTVWGTPRWAAADPHQAGAPWLGPGSGSVPAHMDHWRGFVAALAAQARGRVDAYEIGNEPNVAMFFSGTAHQYADMLVAAAAEIRRVDPAATLVAAGPVVTPGAPARLLAHRWLSREVARTFDAVSVHAYPTTAVAAGPLLRSARAAAAAVSGLAVWLTEVNLLGGTELGPRQQRRAATALLSASLASGYARAHWYAWSALPPGDLLPTSAGTPAGHALEQALTDQHARTNLAAGASPTAAQRR